MAPLTPIQKAVYANQTMAMERESVLRAARVVAKARKELMAKVQAAPKTTSIQQATLSSLDAVLKTLPQDIMKALRTDELVEKGYRQGKSLLLEVAKGTDAEGKLSGFSGILDLRTYSQDANQEVAKIKGLSELAKEKIKAAAELSLALGEGEVDTMRRLFGDIDKPGDKTPFRELKISAERIARTVTNSLVNSGKSSAYQQYANQFPELGILNEWVNVTDFRTSDTCRALVGQKRAPGQMFQGGGFSGFHPPAHPNCRSTIIPTIGEPVEPVQPVEPEPEPLPIPKPEPVQPTPKLTGRERAKALKAKAQAARGVAPANPLLNITYDQQIERGRELVRGILGPKAVDDIAKTSEVLNSIQEEYVAHAKGGDPDYEKIQEFFKRMEAERAKLKDAAVKVRQHIANENSSKVLNIEARDSGPQDVLEGRYISWTDRDTLESRKLRIAESMADHQAADEIEQLIIDSVRFVGGRGANGTTFVYLDQYMQKREGRERGWAREWDRTINVGGGSGVSLNKAIAHEISHVIEFETKGARDINEDWLLSRATGPVEKLSDLTGNKNYDDLEVAHPDHFIDPYVARYYGVLSPTEVLSMGVQEFFTSSDVAALLTKDPEHFYLTVAHMLGEF